MVYSMQADGIISKEQRGLYHLGESHQTSNEDLIKVSLLVPKAIIWLTSALYYYRLTTQIPISISIALPNNTSLPRLTCLEM